MVESAAALPAKRYPEYPKLTYEFHSVYRTPDTHSGEKQYCYYLAVTTTMRGEQQELVHVLDEADMNRLKTSSAARKHLRDRSRRVASKAADTVYEREASA